MIYKEPELQGQGPVEKAWSGGDYYRSATEDYTPLMVATIHNIDMEQKGHTSPTTGSRLGILLTKYINCFSSLLRLLFFLQSHHPPTFTGHTSPQSPSPSRFTSTSSPCKPTADPIMRFTILSALASAGFLFSRPIIAGVVSRELMQRDCPKQDYDPKGILCSGNSGSYKEPSFPFSTLPFSIFMGANGIWPPQLLVFPKLFSQLLTNRCRLHWSLLPHLRLRQLCSQHRRRHCAHLYL